MDGLNTVAEEAVEVAHPQTQEVVAHSTEGVEGVEVATQEEHGATIPTVLVEQMVQQEPVEDMVVVMVVEEVRQEEAMVAQEEYLAGEEEVVPSQAELVA